MKGENTFSVFIKRGHRWSAVSKKILLLRTRTRRTRQQTYTHTHTFTQILP